MKLIQYITFMIIIKFNYLLIWIICLVDAHHYYHYLIFQNEIIVMLLIWVLCLVDVNHYHLPDISKWNINNVKDMAISLMNAFHPHLYLIFQNGILIMLLIWMVCFVCVYHYYHYLIFQNGILIILLIWLVYLVNENKMQMLLLRWHIVLLNVNHYHL